MCVCVCVCARARACADVYGQPLCELGKHVLGPSGSVVKLSFEKRKSGERYVTHLVRGKGVLTVM